MKSGIGYCKRYLGDRGVAKSCCLCTAGGPPLDSRDWTREGALSLEWDRGPLVLCPRVSPVAVPPTRHQDITRMLVGATGAPAAAPRVVVHLANGLAGGVLPAGFDGC